MSEHPLKRYGAVMGLVALVGIIGGFVSGIVHAFFDQGSVLGAGLIAATTALSMVAGLWVSLRWWKALDEAAQEAHKWAFWWGATVGLCLAGVILLTLLYGVADLGDAPVKSSILTGAAIVVGCQMLGYGVAWAAWWLKRR